MQTALQGEDSDAIIKQAPILSLVWPLSNQDSEDSVKSTRFDNQRYDNRPINYTNLNQCNKKAPVELQMPEETNENPQLVNEKIKLCKILHTRKATLQDVSAELSDCKQKEEELNAQIDKLKYQLKQAKSVHARSQKLLCGFFADLVTSMSIERSSQENEDLYRYFLRIGSFDDENEANHCYYLFHAINDAFMFRTLALQQMALTTSANIFADNRKSMTIAAVPVSTSTTQGTCHGTSVGHTTDATSKVSSAPQLHKYLCIPKSLCVCGGKCRHLNERFFKLRFQMSTSGAYFRCPVCEINLYYSCNFEFHFRDKHPKHVLGYCENGLKCCGLKFTGYDRFKAHLLKIDLQSGNF